MFVVQGYADADVESCAAAAVGIKMRAKEDLQTNPAGEPRLWMLSPGVRYRSP